MEVNLEDFRRHFEILSDEALLETNRDDLVDAARGCFDAEVARRGLNTTGAEPAEEEANADHANPGDELVLIATYNIPEEANFARGLLQSAEIPFHLANEYVALGGFQLRLMVPKAFEEQAVEVLETEISDEELAAQAEAAGLVEEEASEEAEPEEAESKEAEPEKAESEEA